MNCPACEGVSNVSIYDLTEVCHCEECTHEEEHED